MSDPTTKQEKDLADEVKRLQEKNAWLLKELRTEKQMMGETADPAPDPFERIEKLSQEVEEQRKEKEYFRSQANMLQADGKDYRATIIQLQATTHNLLAAVESAREALADKYGAVKADGILHEAVSKYKEET